MHWHCLSKQAYLISVKVFLVDCLYEMLWVLCANRTMSICKCLYSLHAYLLIKVFEPAFTGIDIDLLLTRLCVVLV